MITVKKKKRSLWQRIKECFLIDKDKIAFICLNCECVFETDDYTKDDDNVVQTCCPKCGYIVFDFGRKDY